ncbi:MAG: hypothetical protein O7I93_06100 [Gemmatimonadetes bacterium]|nr:hypothetical protein [Gemmatimonadota bacterium]
MNRRPLLIGTVIGAFGFALLRFFFVPFPETVHYHANFAIFIDGERVDLTADEYMEDLSACKVDPSKVLPEERAHMHANNHDVVHVHHGGATWGHFLANIGLGMGADYLITDGRDILLNDGNRKLKFVLSGMVVPPMYNRLIESEQRLLISYGTETAEEVLESQFPQVASNAGEFNTNYDPAGCAGHGQLGFWDRVKYAVWGAGA